MRRAGLYLALVVSVTSLGCGPAYDWRPDVRRTAAFEHGCEIDRVEILGDDGDIVSRSVRLNICGQVRLYRDIGGAYSVVWMDATSTVGGDLGSDAPPAEPEPPPPPPQWSSEAVLGVLRQIHGPILECTGGAELQIWVTLNRSGLLSNVSGINHLAEDVRACVIEAVGRAAAPGDGSPRRVTLRISPGATESPAHVDASATAGAASPPSEESIRTHLDEVSTRVLACLSADSIVVEVTWSARDDDAHASFRGVTDADAIECAEAAVGRLALSPPPSDDGRLIHALAR